jgi:hypothetical protein
MQRTRIHLVDGGYVSKVVEETIDNDSVIIGCEIHDVLLSSDSTR